jgi:hypothetical protein
MFNTEIINWQNFLFIGVVTIVWLMVIKKFEKNHLVNEAE